MQNFSAICQALQEPFQKKSLVVVVVGRGGGYHPLCRRGLKHSSDVPAPVRQPSAAARGGRDGEAVPLHPAPERGLRPSECLGSQPAADAGRLPAAAGRPADQRPPAAGRAAGQPAPGTETRTWRAVGAATAAGSWGFGNGQLDSCETLLYSLLHALCNHLCKQICCKNKYFVINMSLFSYTTTLGL